MTKTAKNISDNRPSVDGTMDSDLATIFFHEPSPERLAFVLEALKKGLS